MRGLQESILITDHKYRVSFTDSSELDEFMQLRSRIAKKVEATKLFDILTVQLAQEDVPPAEFDKSFVDQKNDSSRIGDLIGNREQANSSQKLLDSKPHILENDFLKNAPQTMVLDGVSVRKKTIKSSQESLKWRPDSSNKAKTMKDSYKKMSFTTSIKGLTSDPKFGSNQSLLKSVQKTLSKEVEIEDVETFSSNLKTVPQRMVQKRRSMTNLDSPTYYKVPPKSRDTYWDISDKKHVVPNRVQLTRTSSLNNILVDINKDKDEKIPGVQVDKNKHVEKQYKELVDQIFALMVNKGIINSGFDTKLDIIEKLQLVRKFSK